MRGQKACEEERYAAKQAGVQQGLQPSATSSTLADPSPGMAAPAGNPRACLSEGTPPRPKFYLPCCMLN